MYKFIINKLSFVGILLILFINNAFALTGNEINIKINEWLKQQGVIGQATFSKSSIYHHCLTPLKIAKVFGKYKTVKVNCSGEKKLSFFIRNKINKSSEIKKNKSSKKKKKYKTIRLIKSIEKNSIINSSFIEIFYTNKKGNSHFYNDIKELIGRKAKQNLKIGQFIHPRHLYTKYDINVGDILSIVSRIGKSSVSTTGEAQSYGNLGELIKVKNIRSGKVIKGYLKKNKIIQVFH